MDWKIKPCKKIDGTLEVPPDKSISHRAIMFGAISDGDLRIRNFLMGKDCLRTVEAFRALGIKITTTHPHLRSVGGCPEIVVHGKGLKGLKAPKKEIYLGNSGTSMRIMAGILAGQNFVSVLTGDESLSGRPMRRIIEPLKLMGAKIESAGGHAPLKIHGSSKPLDAIDYKTPVASAQVKSCVLAAGLYADGKTSVSEPFQSRDHTERMLENFSADIKRKGLVTEISGLKKLAPKDIDVPGDISSAAFFIVAALLAGDSHLSIKNVGLNPTRVGVINVLKRMGADIKILNTRSGFEPVGDVKIAATHPHPRGVNGLKGAVVAAGEIPSLIDEIPALAVAMAKAKGQSQINGIAELKVKETDRIKSMRSNLSKMGVSIKEEKNSLVIEGGAGKFTAASLESFGDHRTAMAMAVAALFADGECVIRDTACVDTSYPGFLKDLFSIY